MTPEEKRNKMFFDRNGIEYSERYRTNFWDGVLNGLEYQNTEYLKPLLTQILKGQHEVIDGAFRKEIVPVEHIKKIFGSLSIYEDDTIPF